MLAKPRAPWLAVVGRAASPSEKTARPHIVSRVRDEVKRALLSSLCPACAPSAPGARCWDSALVAWYHSLYAPRTGGAYDSHHGTAGIARCTRRRGGRVAARGARAAAGQAAYHRVSWHDDSLGLGTMDRRFCATA